MRLRRAGWIAASLFAVAALLAIATVVLYIINDRPIHALFPRGGPSLGPRIDLLSLVLALAVGLGFGVMGGFVAARRPRNPIGWLFAAAGIALLIGGFLSEWIHFGRIAGGSLVLLDRYEVLAPRTGETAGWSAVGTWVGLTFVVPALLLLFPTGRLASRRWRSALLFAVLGGIVFLAGISRHYWPDGLGSFQVAGVKPLAYGISVMGNAVPFWFLPWPLAVAISGWSLISRYRTAGADERHQIKWVAFAVGLQAILLLGALTLTFTGAWTTDWNAGFVIAFPLVLLLLPAATAIAIFKYRLYDIDLVIRRTLTYGSLALFITAAYVGVVIGASRFVGRTAATNLPVSLLATGLVAVAFQPARQRAERLASKLVFGEQAEPYEVLAGLARRVGNTLLANEILPLMAESAARGVRAKMAKVRMFLLDGEEVSETWPPGADALAEGRKDLITKQEVFHLGQLVGEIEISKPPHDPIRPAEAKLLADLASQAGLALHQLRLTAELQNHVDGIRRQAEELASSERRLLTADLWAQLKLQRELHEKVEGVVVTLGQTLVEAELSQSGDDQTFRGLLERAVEGARAALEEVRDLARGIFPPLLDAEGIVTALRSQINRSGWKVRLRLQDAIDEMRFDPHAESAVYLCCAEMLKHLSSKPGEPSCELELAANNGVVKFSIRRATSAFSDRLPAPLLREMADRIEALGGKLEVREGTSEGTVISAQVPGHPGASQFAS